ncbi:hypothetical protein [Shinella zoogloeoides]
MLELYLAGSVSQTIERARALSTLFDRAHHRDYDGLRQLCSQKLSETLAGLRQLQSETIVDEALQSPRRLRAFRRHCDRLEEIETIGATALATVQPEAEFLNAVVRSICGDIAYPLIPPVVSNLSTSHFYIRADYNLLTVPLLEGRYFLHLADIYHELAHPLLHPAYNDRPVLEPYRKAFGSAKIALAKQTAASILEAKRAHAVRPVQDQFLVWGRLWQTYWLEESFCDIFAALTCGPAYAWSHYHLAIKKGYEAFEVPTNRIETHPADDARMRMILAALTRIGFAAECATIQAAWENLMDHRSERAEPEYRQCYPDHLIETIVDLAHRGIEAIGTQLAVPGALTPWAERLDMAWQVFWQQPDRYNAWESEHMRLAAGAMGIRRSYP